MSASDQRTVAGRALVVPASTRRRLENESNLSADSRVRSTTHLVAVSAADGLPVDSGVRAVDAALPNWLRVVMDEAGANRPLSPRLPERLEVDVTIDAVARTIVTLDVDAAVREHAELRGIGVHDFERTDSVLAPLRNAVELPGAARRGVRRLFGAWRDAVSEMVADVRTGTEGQARPSWTDAEIEQMRRQATVLAHRFELHPGEREQARTRALTALPMQAEAAASGALAREDFDAMVMRELVSTAITAEEAATFRRAAGIDEVHPGSDPEA